MNEKVLACVYSAIDELNEDGIDLEKSPETAIHGTASSLDSLGLINFVVSVEECVERDLGVMVALGDDRALTQQPPPFESVRTLVDYIETLVSEQQR